MPLEYKCKAVGYSCSELVTVMGEKHGTVALRHCLKDTKAFGAGNAKGRVGGGVGAMWPRPAEKLKCDGVMGRRNAQKTHRGCATPEKAPLGGGGLFSGRFLPFAKRGRLLFEWMTHVHTRMRYPADDHKHVHRHRETQTRKEKMRRQTAVKH